METTSTNRISTLIQATAEAFGVDLILEKVADLIRAELAECPELDARPEEDFPSPVMVNIQEVHGLPPDRAWSQTSAEMPVKKKVAGQVRASSHGVVLRHEAGSLHFAKFDSHSGLIKVPGGYRTSRSLGPEFTIPKNGAYRWQLVGFVEAPGT